MGMVWSVQKHPAPTTKFYDDFVKDLPSLEGKTVAITGCTSGTGLVLARTCVKKNARLIMVNRPSPRAKSALELLRAEDGVDDSQVTLVECDLCSLESVRSAASKIRDICSESGLDVLCNNAGLMVGPFSHHLSLIPSPKINPFHLTFSVNPMSYDTGP